jgi:hypothetical protein
MTVLSKYHNLSDICYSNRLMECEIVVPIDYFNDGLKDAYRIL